MKRQHLWRAAILAPILALATWLLLPFVMTPRVPDDFPNLPDVAGLNPALRDLLVSFDKEARNDPGSAEVVGRLGMAYHSNQFFEQAAAAYTIAARLAQDDYQWAYCQAVLDEENGREKEQFDRLQHTVGLKPDHVPALLKLADGYFKQDKLDEAARYYEKAAAAAGSDSSLQPLFGLGRIAARRQEWNKVVEYVTPVSTAYPFVRPPHALLLQAYEALGNAEKAAEVRQKVLQPQFTVVPPAKDALHDDLISLCHSSTRLLKEAGLVTRFGYPDRGIELGRRAAEADPKDADARHFIARTVLNAYGERPEAVDEALTQVDEGLRLRPEDLVPLWDLAASFFERPKTAAAVERLHTALARYADRPDSHFYLGLVADEQGRTDEAVAQYRAALKVNPNNAEVYNKLGLILVTQARLDEAISSFQKSIELDPMYTIARFNLGVALVQRGRNGQALKELGEVLRIKPNDPPTHLYCGIALMASRRLPEAIAHFGESLRFKPDDAEAHYGLACAYSLQMKRAQAVNELEQALRLRPDYPEARDLLQKLER
ncbi:MAG: tetratricopeptide repeat protein [Acidobacteria bacterium]|nr:MAG: tetratricopeptide repeat protein [Acidobacteriota bacterium]